jgi:hypothetical protein
LYTSIVIAITSCLAPEIGKEGVLNRDGFELCAVSFEGFFNISVALCQSIEIRELKESVRALSIQVYSMMFHTVLPASEQRTTGRPLTRSRSPLLGDQLLVHVAYAFCRAGTHSKCRWVVENHPPFLLESLEGYLHSGLDRQLVHHPNCPRQPLGPRLPGVRQQSDAIHVSTFSNVAE